MNTSNFRKLSMAATMAVVTTLAAGTLRAATEEGMTISPGGPPIPQVQHHENIAYVSGGASEEERSYLKGMERDFNLKVVTAIKDGDYLSDMQIRIQNTKGKTVLETTAKGPWLYAKLPAGTYKIEASGFDQHYEKTVKVSGEHLAQVDFYWPNKDMKKMPSK
jgi:hypothetical protein